MKKDTRDGSGADRGSGSGGSLEPVLRGGPSTVRSSRKTRSPRRAGRFASCSATELLRG